MKERFIRKKDSIYNKRTLSNPTRLWIFTASLVLGLALLWGSPTAVHADALPPEFGDCTDCIGTIFDGANGCASAGQINNGPGNPTTPVGADENYSVFIGGTLTLEANISFGAAESEGKTFLYGDLINNKGYYDIGFAGGGSCVTPASTADYFLHGGATSGTNNTGSYDFNRTPVADLTPFDDTIAELETISTCMAAQPQSTNAVVNGGALTCSEVQGGAATCPAGLYMFDLQTALSGVYTFDGFDDSGNTAIVVNVNHPGPHNFRSFTDAGSALNLDILWNFPTTTQVDLPNDLVGGGSFAGDYFKGSILIADPAANSAVSVSGMDGRFITFGNVVHDGAGAELHSIGFRGNLILDQNLSCTVQAGTPDVTITKTLNTSTVPTPTVGAPISFTIQIENSGDEAITQLSLEDTFDPAFLAYNNTLGSTPQSDSPIVNGSPVNWTNLVTTSAPLAPGNSIFVTVNFIALQETASTVNTATITSWTTVSGPQNTNPTDNADVPIDPEESKLTIGDLIWHDINNDGTKDATEPGINGVVVNMYELDAPGGNRVVGTQVTSTTLTLGGIDGSYTFQAISGKNYEVEIDASNFLAGGALEGYTLGQNQTNVTGSSQFITNIQDNDPDIDFGYYCPFDLALVKALGAGQAATIAPGDDITFTMTVYNQGVVTATNITVADYIPGDFTLNDPNWTAGSPATRNLGAVEVAPGGSTTVDIVLTAGTVTGVFTNTAEIASAEDPDGNSPPDVDSTPDTTNDEDPVKDDVIDEDGKNNPGVDDEDDHDIATVTVTDNPVFDLALDKKLAAGQATSIAPGDDVTFSITVYNQGTVAATSITVADYLPTGFTLNDTDWTPGSPATIALTGVPLAPGGSTNVDITLTAGTVTGVFTNTAEIAAAVDENGNSIDVDSTPDSNNDDTPVKDDVITEDAKTNPGVDDEDDHDIAPITVTANPVPEITVEKSTNGPGQAPQDADTATGPTINAGDTVTWTYDITNSGAVTLTDIIVVDNPEGTVTTCPETQLDPLESMTCILTGVAQVGQYMNTVVVTGTPTITGMPVVTNTDPSHYVGQSLIFDLALRKTAAAGPYFVGDPITFTIEIFNQGQVDAFDIDVIDYVPANTTYTSSNAAAVVSTANTNAVAITDNGGGSFTINTLAAGDSVSFDAILTIDGAFAGTAIRNWAEIEDASDSAGGPTATDTDSTPDSTNFDGAGETDDLVDDNVIDEDGKNVQGDDEDDHDPAEIVVTQIVAQPALQVIKSLNGSNPFVANEMISFNIQIINTGDAVLTSIPLEDRFNSVFIEYMAAGTTPAPDTVLDGVLQWDDVLVSAGDTDGLGVGESMNVTVFFTTLADTTQLPVVAPCTSTGHAPNLAYSIGAMAGTAAVEEDADDKSCSSVAINVPTGVLLAERSISQTAGGVLVEWQMADGINEIGFNIWRSNGVDAEMRNIEMITAQVTAQSAGHSGASYSWLDEGATLSRGDTYVLEVIKADGSTDRTIIDVMSGEDIFLPLLWQ